MKYSFSVILVVLISFPFILFSQSTAASLLKEEQGTLLLKNQLNVVSAYSKQGKINLEYVRSVGNFLTDVDNKYYKKAPLPKKKQAFIFHVKQLIEELETAYQNNQSVNDSINELFWELALYEASIKQKALSNASSKVKTFEKAEMEIDYIRSGYKFTYPKKDSSLSNGLQQEEQNSPFWHKPMEQASPEKRFAQLAKQKKIKAKKEMVVVFDELSLSGSAPKINVLDLDNKWVLKWGDEVHTDVLGSHIFAALGYDVDHPYFYGQNKLTLVFEDSKKIKNSDELKQQLQKNYHVDLTPFITSFGVVTSAMAEESGELKPFVGKQYVRFKKCVMEARPDRVKRLGSFLPNAFANETRRALRAALLAHAFIGNWDTREQNTLLTCVNGGNHQYRMSAVFSDLGTSFGVKTSLFPADFKVGLVNEFGWEVCEIKKNKIKITNRINSILKPYESATYTDLLWMAKKIRDLDEPMLRYMISKAQWPEPIAELYFHKLASRRASIIKAFNLADAHPISFDKKLSVKINDVYIVKDGVLITDFEKDKNPESFLSTPGRLTNYGY